MTVKTRAELKAENATDFPDNTARLISPADLRGQMDDIVDSAVFPEDGTLGLYDPQASEAVGDGTTDDRDALLAADADADSAASYLFINKIYKIDSDLTLASGVAFGPEGRLKPASGVTVTLAGGFSATPTRHLFDISLGGHVWSTVECRVTARNYGAIGDTASVGINPGAPISGGTNDRAAFQALIDCCLYFMKAQAVHLDAGSFFIEDAPLIVNYGDATRNISLIGAGYSYGPGGNFPGTWFRSGHWGNCIEVHGARGCRIEGIGFEGPAYLHLYPLSFGSPGISPSGPDPYDHMSWIPDEAQEIGALNRYKMNAAIHVDPRCGTQPVATEKTAVRLVVNAVPAATGYANGDTVQGVTLATGDRVLFATSIDIDGWPGDAANGVYVVQASGTPVRSTDFDAAAEFPDFFVSCTAGDHAGEKWVCNNHSIATLGTSNIDFRQFDGTLSYEDYTYPAWTGVATQYNKVLSSAVKISHCLFRGFGAAFAVKGCNASSNADYIQLEYCTTAYPGNCYGFVWGNNQGRMQSALNCNFFGARCHVSTSVVGQQNGKAHFSAVNTEIAGAVDMVDIPNMSVAGGVSLEMCYAEVGNRIGRVTTTSTGTSGLEIAGGNFGFSHQYWLRVPRWIIDCRNVGVVIQPTTSFTFMSCPLIIRADPRLCHIWAKVSSPIWMTGAASPATIAVGEAILLHSTMGVLFNHDTVRRQGPWTGGGFNEVWSVTTGGTRTSRNYGRHAFSSVSVPIPFCAETVSPAEVLFDPVAEPLPVALGAKAQTLSLGGGGFTGAPSQSGRTLTLVLSSTPTLSNAQNQGFVPGSIICDVTTGNLFVITALATATITAKQLNNYDYATDIALWPSVAPNPLDFFPTGHYTPNAGLELTYVSGDATVTFQRSDGTTSDNAQLPLGAAKLVNNSTDAMTPVLRANSAITASAAGTIELTGTGARRSTTERSGIWFVPRP